MKVLCFGEVLWDHIEGAYHVEGPPFNFAAHFARFGSDNHLISGVVEVSMKKGIPSYGQNILNESRKTAGIGGRPWT